MLLTPKRAPNALKTILNCLNQALNCFKTGFNTWSWLFCQQKAYVKGWKCLWVL